MLAWAADGKCWCFVIGSSPVGLRTKKEPCLARHSRALLATGESHSGPKDRIASPELDVNSTEL